MAGFCNGGPLSAFDVARPHLHESWRREQIRVRGDYERPRRDRRELGERVRRAEWLRRSVGWARMLFDLEPAFRAFGIAAAIRRADFAKMRRQCSDAGDFESCDDVLYFFVADRSGACRNDEA